MPRASTPTKLSLCQFAECIGIDDLLFAQLNTGKFKKCGCGKQCELLWTQHKWQGSGWNREALAKSIAWAENKIEAGLGVPLCPQYKSRIFDWPKGCGKTSASLKLEVDNVFLAGPKVTSHLGSVETADAWQGIEQDGCFWPQVLTVSFDVPGGTRACELTAYYPDRAGEETYQIDCGKFEVKGCVATYTVRAWELIKPELYDQWFLYDADCPDGSIDATQTEHYVEHIEICRTVLSPQPPIRLIWYGDDDICGCNHCNICKIRCAPGCVIPDFAHAGRVTVHYAELRDGEWCAVDRCSYSRPPDAVEVCYWHYPLLDSVQQWPDCYRLCVAECPPVALQYAIAALAATRMPCITCKCSCNSDAGLKKMGELQYDKGTAVQSATEARSTYISKAEKGFGTTVGGMEAWNDVCLIRAQLPQPEVEIETVVV